MLSIGFINVTTPNSNKSNDNNHDMTIASYMEDNVGSLGVLIKEVMVQDML